MDQGDNIHPETFKLPKENTDELYEIKALGKTAQKSHQKHKAKTKKRDSIKPRCRCTAKGHDQQSEKATHRMGDILCTLHNREGTCIQDLQEASETR